HLPGEEIKRRGVLPRTAEQVSDVMQPLRIAQPAEPARERERPVLALVAEGVRRHGGDQARRLLLAARTEEIADDLRHVARVTRPEGHRITLELDQTRAGDAGGQVDRPLERNPGDAAAMEDEGWSLDLAEELRRVDRERVPQQGRDGLVAQRSAQQDGGLVGRLTV